MEVILREICFAHQTIFQIQGYDMLTPHDTYDYVTHWNNKLTLGYSNKAYSFRRKLTAYSNTGSMSIFSDKKTNKQSSPRVSIDSTNNTCTCEQTFN